MARYDFTVSTEGDTVVLSLTGHPNAKAIRHLLELAEAAAADNRRVEIDLDGVGWLTEDGAALLLFRRLFWHRLPAGVALRTSSRPGRQAVLRAYARKRLAAAETA